MGRNSIPTFILTADVIAVVDDGLCTVDEVTRGFPLIAVVVVECEITYCNSIVVQCCQGIMFVIFIRTLLMYVFGIYEATTHTRLHVDEIELYHTRDVTPVLLIQVIASTLFCG